MTAAPPRPRPMTGDRDTGGFWEAAQRRELVVAACDSCGAFLHMPTAHCGRCGSWSTTWKQVAPTGRLHSWAVVEHQVHPAFEVPYTIVLVDLDDAPGVRMVGHLDGAPELVQDQPMEVRWEELDETTVLPQWQPRS